MGQTLTEVIIATEAERGNASSIRLSSPLGAVLILSPSTAGVPPGLTMTSSIPLWKRMVKQIPYPMKAEPMMKWARH
jgi:hypothetical protein